MVFQKRTVLQELPPEAKDAVAERVDRLLRTEDIPYRIKEVFLKEVFSHVVDASLEDLAALVYADPAARKSWYYALEAYRCLEAVFTYRVAHQIVK